MVRYLDSYVPSDLVKQNSFIGKPADTTPLPLWPDARELLPAPFWEGHEDALACYWKSWELAMGNLRLPTPGNGFVAPYIDTAFNNCLFLWDSVFILMFGRYGRRVFDFQRTLDNLYCKQHRDGFICREIRETDGTDQFHRHDVGSTGPNILAWSEWEHYLTSGDRERLAAVFPVILAYHRWTRRYRTWPDGSYFSCGWGCGMDNQPRVPGGHEKHSYHGHLSWIDATCQAAFSGRVLAAMAQTLDRHDTVGDCTNEVAALSEYVNQFMWDERRGYYCDRLRDGSLSQVMSIGAWWALLAGIVPDGRRERFIGSLRDPRRFNRPHRVPSLSADHQGYVPTGGYWNGAVWPPTNYMILRGLTECGEDELAREIGCNHHDNVVNVFNKTGTLWENYAPETADPGQPAKKDFVGWGGVGPVAVLFEYVFGLRPDVPRGRLVWDVRCVEAHGVRRYPFGHDGVLDLACDARGSDSDPPRITASSNVSLTVDLRWNGGSRELRLPE